MSHLETLCRHEVFACSSEEMPLSFYALIISLSLSFFLSNSSTLGIVVLCVDLNGRVGGVGRSRTGIRENAFGGFVVAVLLSGV